MQTQPGSNRTGSLQTTLFTIFTVVTFLISCLFITLHSFDKASTLRRHAKKEVHLLARQLADAVRLPLFAENVDALLSVAEKAGQVPGIAKVVIRTVDGRVLARFPAVDVPLAGRVISETQDVLSLASEPSLENGLPVPGSGALIGTVQVVRQTDDLKLALYHDVVLSGLLTLCFWLAVSGLSLPVLRRVTRSYNALVKGVQSIKEGDYSSRIEVVSSDESGRVAQAFNGLAQTLEQRQAENQRLHRQLVASIEMEVQAKEELSQTNALLEQEITERIHAEQTARNSEQTLKALMDVMPVGVLTADLHGRVQYLNGFFAECFGYGIDEIGSIDDWFARVFPDPEYHLAMSRAQAEALAREQSEPLEARVTCRNGRVRRVILSNQRHGEETIFIVIDLTDRELIKEQSIKVQKLESLGVLAGGIAHNFNNALTGVLGFISLAANLVDSGHRAQEYLQFATKASQRAAGMAKQLLTFATGGAPVKKPVALGRLIEEAVSLTLNGSNVRCELKLPTGLPQIRGDEGQLIQAFSNIVLNAMQAMPEGGTIAVSAEAGSRCCQDANHGKLATYLSISFADQGHGIAEADLARIFDPYFSTKQTNTGLGLASVHSIIYKHGGHVTVESTPGLGSTFTICLPVTAGAGEPAEEALPVRPLAAGPGGTVLILDDEEMIREFSRKTLAFLGYQTVVCAEGAEAVELYRERFQAGEPFLAGILDLTIPGGMGGVEVAQQILAIDPAAKLIVSSGYSYDPVMARHKEYGFCAAVAKPYKAEELSYELRLLHG
ncbi:hypothetical protein GMST_18800 [Geomonas silvestris]|uniref:histidine kinase n=1 Tax=Geomonas silvestris TaxID=2740184 RepID=A0A6V8MHU4_9BACT|nr:ATP-binding protein [Geomonas silvestris]GFO59555.1 hypothetical protein GMST_18800 [Geomonas silvestris]